MGRRVLVGVVIAAWGCGVGFEDRPADADPGPASSSTSTGAPSATSAASTGGDGGARGGDDTSGGAGAGGGSPSATMAALDGLRVELPCGPHFVTPSYGCPAESAAATVTADGDPDHVYAVTLRVRGVMEQNSYTGGTQNGAFYTGGAPDNGGWNEVRLSVSAPAVDYYFNAGTAGITHCFAYDYDVTVPIEGGATLTLLHDGKDGAQVINIDEVGDPLSVPEIGGLAQPYDGQFVQLDVVAIAQR